MASGTPPPFKRAAMEANEARKAFIAVLILRVVAVVLVMVTLTIRPTLPARMLELFEYISYPLFVSSLLSLAFHKKTEELILKYRWILYVDLLISVGIILIGGSWRSSYFGYTITSIILFTLFNGRAGAYFSSFVLIMAATIKDPSGGLSAEDVYFVSNWDMRMGAALIYATAGAILGYFSSLLNKIDTLSTQRIEEARKVSAMEEKNRLALDLHDGSKQMVNAILITLNPLIKKTNSMEKGIASDLQWLWNSMNHLHRELASVMLALQEKDDGTSRVCNVAAIAKEEARIAEAVTGFTWDISVEADDIILPPTASLPLRRFFGEAYMNAWKHSGVRRGQVELCRSPEFCTVTVHDPGAGADISNDDDDTISHLTSLRHRAKELQGDLTIETAPNRGFKLILKLPTANTARPINT